MSLGCRKKISHIRERNISRVISYRPGVISNRSAFESMAQIYKYLQKKYNYKISIIKSPDDKYEDADFNIITIPNAIWKYIPDTPFRRYPLVYKKRLYKIIKNADVVLTVDPTVYPQGLFAISAAYHYKIPVWIDASLTITGNGPSFIWKLSRLFYRNALYKTAGIIATVPKCMERYQDLKLYDERIAKKITIMGHPVDTEKFRPNPRKFASDGIIRILTVSRLVPEKGLYYILDAISPILQERDDVSWDIIGEGPMQSFLVKNVKERNLAGKVKFHEKVAHDKLPSILNAFDIFINHAVPTQRWEEYFGAANLEAMACGLPCVLSRSGGIPYSVREIGVAEMVEPRNITEIRHALEMLISNPEIRAGMGRRAVEYVKRYYDIAIISKKYHSMIDSGMMSHIDQ